MADAMFDEMDISPTDDLVCACKCQSANMICNSGLNGDALDLLSDIAVANRGSLKITFIFVAMQVSWREWKAIAVAEATKGDYDEAEERNTFHTVDKNNDGFVDRSAVYNDFLQC